MLIEYTQCAFIRKETNRKAYIPSIHAKVGKKLRLRDENGRWSNGWVVTDTGETIAKSFDQISREPAKYFRAQTDIG